MEHYTYEITANTHPEERTLQAQKNLSDSGRGSVLMPSADDIEYFAGKPIKLFRIAEGIVDPVSFAYNVGYSFEEYDDPSYEEKWQAFLNDPRVSEVSALVITGDLNQVTSPWQ